MTTNYPGGFDTFPAHGATMDVAPTHENGHLNMEDSIEAMQIEFGLDPSGASSTVRARLDSIDGPWTNYSPGVTITNLTLGSGVLTARYRTLGAKTVLYAGQFQFGAGSVVGVSPIGISLPIAPAYTAGTHPMWVGPAWVNDSGTREYAAICRYNAGTGRIDIIHTESGNAGSINSTNPMTWASGDSFGWSIQYETP
jgi:hypothetical protein